MMMNKEIIKPKVLVVDDSAFMRKFISDIVEKSGEFDLIGVARNGEDALRKIRLLKPDIVTMDVEMPKLDGLSTLKEIMGKNPLPVVMVSSLTRKGSEITIEALSAGAVDFVTKPSLFKGESSEEIKRLLPEKLKAAARAHLENRPALPPPPPAGTGKGPAASTTPTVSAVSPAPFAPVIHKLPSIGQKARHIVAIGASTGGPRALEEVLRGLPGDLPAAVLITQHMPPGFTESLAKRLDRVSFLKVKEASEGDVIMEGSAYLARGGLHLIVNSNHSLSLDSSAPVQHVRPSADVMMKSIAEHYGSATMGVILTGMGRDGTEGMNWIRSKGGKTVVQEPSTAVIPSMPQAVIKSGLADEVVPLNQVAATVARLLR